MNCFWYIFSISTIPTILRNPTILRYCQVTSRKIINAFFYPKIKNFQSYTDATGGLFIFCLSSTAVRPLHLQWYQLTTTSLPLIQLKSGNSATNFVLGLQVRTLFFRRTRNVSESHLCSACGWYRVLAGRNQGAAFLAQREFIKTLCMDPNAILI
jgi:hypothetical protein